MDGWNDTPMALATQKNTLLGKKPIKIIPVPDEFRRVTLLRERDTLVNDLKIKTDCVVVPHWDHGKIYQFDIYGSGAGVEKAIRQLNHWISNAHVKSNASSVWAKTPAFDFDEWYYEQVTEMEDDRTQMFKGPRPDIPENALKPPSLIIDWPEDLRNHHVTPRDVFGNKLEALDTLRMRDEVFITLLPNNNGLWQVEILGFDTLNVQVAKEHYDTMISRVKTDTFGLQHSLNLILDEGEGIEVVLEQAEQWWPNHNDKIVPRLRPSPMTDKPGSFRREGLHFRQLERIQKSIQLALEAVRRKKGSYDFAVRLGCLALGSKKMPDNQVGKTFQKPEFLRAIDSSVDLVVKKWALDYELGWALHRRLVAASHLLEPTKSANYYGHTPSSLEQTRPIFRGTWVFSDPDSSISQPARPIHHVGRPAPIQQEMPVSTVAQPTGLFVVQVDWTDDEDGLYEKTDMRFYKLEPGKTAPKLNMDINLMELGESRAWYFALESMTPVSRKLAPPLLTGFADHVAMLPKYDIHSSKSFARWDVTPTIMRHLQYARLDKIYSFGIQETRYKAELTAMWYPREKTPVWGLAVRHLDWATHLAELERLSVGSQASWAHSVDTFLPDNGVQSCASEDEEDLGMKQMRLDNKHEFPTARNGIRVLLKKLMELSEIVSSVTALREVSVCDQVE